MTETDTISEDDRNISDMISDMRPDLIIIDDLNCIKDYFKENDEYIQVLGYNIVCVRINNCDRFCCSDKNCCYWQCGLYKIENCHKGIQELSHNVTKSPFRFPNCCRLENRGILGIQNNYLLLCDADQWNSSYCTNFNSLNTIFDEAWNHVKEHRPTQ